MRRPEFSVFQKNQLNLSEIQNSSQLFFWNPEYTTTIFSENQKTPSA